ncbi:MAG: hypothetical protein K5851_08585 [Lachnospiraceae bacterium]|nr:hypothetical protein [Lachnospiraceae bacterium]
MVKKNDYIIILFTHLIYVIVMIFSAYRLDFAREYNGYAVADEIIDWIRYGRIIVNLVWLFWFYLIVDKSLYNAKKATLYGGRKKVLIETFRCFARFALIYASGDIFVVSVIAKYKYHKVWINWDDQTSFCSIANRFCIDNMNIVKLIIISICYLFTIYMVNLCLLLIISNRAHSRIMGLIGVIAFDGLLGWGIRGEYRYYFKLSYYGFKYSKYLVGNVFVYLILLICSIYYVDRIIRKQEWV